MSFTGMSTDRKFVEIIELREEHPWFLGCQFHPELKSKPSPVIPLQGLHPAARAPRGAARRRWPPGGRRRCASPHRRGLD